MARAEIRFFYSLVKSEHSPVGLFVIWLPAAWKMLAGCNCADVLFYCARQVRCMRSDHEMVCAFQCHDFRPRQMVNKQLVATLHRPIASPAAHNKCGHFHCG